MNARVKTRENRDLRMLSPYSTVASASAGRSGASPRRRYPKTRVLSRIVSALNAANFFAAMAYAARRFRERSLMPSAVSAAMQITDASVAAIDGRSGITKGRG